MKLKHEGKEFAVCAYTKGSGGTTSSTPKSFKRRAYWKVGQEKDYIMVHYLDEANKYYIQWDEMM